MNVGSNRPSRDVSVVPHVDLDYRHHVLFSSPLVAAGGGAGAAQVVPDEVGHLRPAGGLGGVGDDFAYAGDEGALLPGQAGLVVDDQSWA
jgi:hypothetical protein